MQYMSEVVAHPVTQCLSARYAAGAGALGKSAGFDRSDVHSLQSSVPLEQSRRGLPSGLGALE